VKSGFCSKDLCWQTGIEAIMIEMLTEEDYYRFDLEEEEMRWFKRHILAGFAGV
jgi:hypothetical protein